MQSEQEVSNLRVGALGGAGCLAFVSLMLLPAAFRLSLPGGLYLVAALLIVVGTFGWASRRWARWLAVVGLLLGVSVAAERLASPGPGGGFEPTRRASLVTEHDMNVVAATWLPLTGWFDRHENDGFARSIADLSRAIRREEGSLPSRGRSDETLLYATESDPHGTVVFLHGYGGNVASFCWVVASAANRAGWQTVCPSCGFEGAWWEPPCADDVERWVESVGDHPVVLAGLSNGGLGASRLASSLPSLDGLVLISGVSPGGSANGLPTLLIYGERDRRFAPSYMEDFAATSSDATQLPMPFGHFLLAKEFEAVRDAVSAWLAERT